MSAKGVSRRKMFKTGRSHIKNLPYKNWSNLKFKQLWASLKQLGSKLSKTPKDS